MLDKQSGEPKMPKGTVGFRWKTEKGKWNLKLEDGLDDSPIDPTLSFFEQHDEVLQVAYHEFAENKTHLRGIPVRYIETKDGRVPVATAFDLLMAQFGVGRGLPGEYPKSYDEVAAYTPASQAQYRGTRRD